MGYYLKTSGTHGKAQEIANRFGGEILPKPPASYAEIPEGLTLIVVVNNGLFEAAAFCYDEAEFRNFTHVSESRPRQYVLILRETAEAETGYGKW